MILQCKAKTLTSHFRRLETSDSKDDRTNNKRKANGTFGYIGAFELLRILEVLTEPAGTISKIRRVY